MLKLTPQQFAAVFDCLREAGTTGGSDKRQAARMQVQTRVRMAKLEGGRVGRCFTALTRDISYSGVGLFQNMPAESGEMFLVTLPAGRHGELTIVSAARFCRPLADGMFGLGAEFASIAEPALVARLKQSGEGAVDRIRQSILQ